MSGSDRDLQNLIVAKAATARVPGRVPEKAPVVSPAVAARIEHLRRLGWSAAGIARQTGAALGDVAVEIARIEQRKATGK